MKTLIAKLKEQGVDIVNLDARTASVRLRSACSIAQIAASEKLAARVSQFYHEGTVNVGGDGTQFNYERTADIIPSDDDYISVKFRALSKTIVPGHWIDWSKDGVLKNSASKLLGQTVYPNHDFTDITKWLGSVASVAWDEAGEQSEGVPGINVEYKIDALMNPRIARGLMMKPPAIHSTSMTVLFKYEYSHPEIAADNKYRFFDLLGEEVEGQIVRLVVTEILEYWEASLVFQGADRLAKQHTTETDLAGMSADTDDESELNTGVKKMKLTQEQKTKLGIGFDGDDVPETEILTAAETLAEKLSAVDQTNIAELTARAEAGDALVSEKRADVTRLARLAELGADDGELEPVIAEQIAGASVDQLQKLGSYYSKKVADRFPAGGRSSEEDSSKVEQNSADEDLPNVTVL